jgi:zinc D-Ala-D-Ala carboxypeptidase
MKLSQNFTLKEMTQSQTALRNHIDNSPNDLQIQNIEELVKNILQPLRDYYEAPLKITSCYRSSKLCEKIGSSSNSQHCANRGAAADFEIPGYDNKQVASHIKNNFDFDQLILEYYDESDINSGWIHCSFLSNKNRKESLIKDNEGYHQWK